MIWEHICKNQILIRMQLDINALASSLVVSTLECLYMLWFKLLFVIKFERKKPTVSWNPLGNRCWIKWKRKWKWPSCQSMEVWARQRVIQNRHKVRFSGPHLEMQVWNKSQTSTKTRKRSKATISWSESSFAFASSFFSYGSDILALWRYFKTKYIFLKATPWAWRAFAASWEAMVPAYSAKFQLI